ncbi:GyrI-like domain-containing protein [Fulvivirga ulvae]|uniref:GyrI-like domain-containing protein n=1 Tax=Fulvivirga ulvae TaxID=2904245 RepID=UPI001F3CAE18|nr:GyrI-like domain-containing protein [Fulvivirga ulvae]UII34394.1 GyrI-like domain-containing protein [Fulvivirga ulvae]
MTSLEYPKQEAAIVKIVIYKVKHHHPDDFEEVHSLIRSEIEKFPGFMEYRTLKAMSNDLLFIDLVKWSSPDSAKAAANKINHMKEFVPLMSAFDDILIMDAFELFTDEVFRHRRKPDLFKNDSNYYKVTKEPVLIELDPTNYLSIQGVSAPDNRRFTEALEAVHAVACHLKFTSKAAGKDFVVSKIEEQWWVESDVPFNEAPREDWYWNILIRLPEFITSNNVDEAAAEVIGKNNIMLASEVQFITLNEGKSVQVLHVGPYGTEKSAIEKVTSFIHENRLQVNGHHHKIYISDPRNTPERELKTIIRYPVCMAPKSVMAH